jgi:predicted ATPase/DNA-binding CsgD family transcriptional regulator
MANPTACIGRERELRQVWDQLRATLHAGVRAVVVTGEPGIGKTRLLTEVAARATRAGLTVLCGGTSEAAGMPAYLPFLEAIGQLIRSTPAEILRQQVGADAGCLAGLFPELGMRLADLPLPHAIPADQARLRLFQAVAGFLEVVAEDGLVLVIDDLQWADSSSLDLIAHVARQRPTARILFLMACRAGDIALTPVLERLLAQLTRLRVLTQIALEALAEGDIANLAAEALGGSVEPTASRALYEHSEGNPFFAEELLVAWRNSGALARAVGGCDWALRLPVGESLPASIASAIRLRLIALPPDVVDALRVAAVIGRAFDVDLLAQVLHRSPDAVEEHLIVAERAGLVRGDRAGKFAFSHDKVRECLHNEVSSTRCQVLHGQIGLALEADQGREGARQLADLAYHFAHSRDHERGVRYLARAAEEAMRTYAPQQALAHLKQALALVDGTDPQRGALLLALGEAALMAADDIVAKAAFVEAQTWYGRRPELAESARAAYGSGIAHWRLDEAEAARQALETALAMLETAAPPDPAAVQVLVALANLLGVVLGRQEDAVRHGRRALEIAQQLDDEALQASAGRTVGFLLVRDNDLAAGLPLLEQALARAQRSANPVESAACCAYLAQAFCWSALLGRSLEVSLLRETYARVGPQPHEQSYVYTWLAFLDALRGAWAEVEQHLARAQAAIERVVSVEPRAFYQQVVGFLAFQQGDYRRAEGELRIGIEIFRTQDPAELLLCLGLYGLALQAAGRYQEARACMAEQEALITTLTAGSLSVLSARGCLALMAVRAGDLDGALRASADLLACRGQHHWFLVDRVLGEVATLANQWSDATAYLNQAAEIADREGLLPEKGHILVAQANLELARSGAAAVVRARRHLTEALTLFTDLRNASQMQHLRQRLRELPQRREDQACAPAPGGLSPREVEVLRLIAEGKRNHQIGQALHISSSTVAKHITAILGKTGCDNRAAAAAYALRHGLA